MTAGAEEAEEGIGNGCGGGEGVGLGFGGEEEESEGINEQADQVRPGVGAFAKKNRTTRINPPTRCYTGGGQSLAGGR